MTVNLKHFRVQNNGICSTVGTRDIHTFFLDSVDHIPNCTTPSTETAGYLASHNEAYRYISGIAKVLAAARLKLEEIDVLTQTSIDSHPDADDFRHAFGDRIQELQTFIEDLEEQHSALGAEDTPASGTPKPDEGGHFDAEKAEDHKQKDDVFCGECTASFAQKDVLDVGCGHCYCRICLATMFEASITSVELPCEVEVCLGNLS